jgi:PTS system N-acetylgalactosamine-specific IIA component
MSDAEPTPMARALVAGHADLAAGLVSAVAQITGREALFVPLSNAGMGREQLESVLRATLADAGAGVVFTDLPGGSWTIAARRVQRDLPSLVVVTGVNLAMLLEYAFHGEASARAAAAAALEKGRSAMLVAGGAVVD